MKQEKTKRSNNSRYPQVELPVQQQEKGLVLSLCFFFAKKIKDRLLAPCFLEFKMKQSIFSIQKKKRCAGRRFPLLVIQIFKERYSFDIGKFRSVSGGNEEGSIKMTSLDSVGAQLNQNLRRRFKLRLTSNGNSERDRVYYWRHKQFPFVIRISFCHPRIAKMSTGVSKKHARGQDP